MASGGKAPVAKAAEATAKSPVKPAAPAVAPAATQTALADGVDAARLKLASTMPADTKAADAVAAPAPVDSKSVPASGSKPKAGGRPTTASKPATSAKPKTTGKPQRRLGTSKPPPSSKDGGLDSFLDSLE
ncbi:MAG TPA: hypothetical protein VG433_07780 [Pirellulales bacterium]|jgi:hypothetical protein|nr:hypothetical protein [Pirellulales bacterium]